MKLLGCVIVCALVASCIAVGVNSEETEVDLQLEDYNEGLDSIAEYHTEYENEDNGLKEFWDKVKKACKKLKEKLRRDIKAVIGEYRPEIMKALHNATGEAIQAGKDWVIEVKKGVVKVFKDGVLKAVISGLAGISYEDEEDNGLKEFWGKVKRACKKLKGKLKADVTSILGEYKKKIMTALHNATGEAIQAGKDWVIQVKKGVIKVFKDGVLKIAISGMVGMSYEENSKVGDKIKEIWHKIQAAFKAFGQKIAAAARKVGEKISGLIKAIDDHTAKLQIKITRMAAKLGAKIAAHLQEAVGKYKDIIIDALTKDGKVIIGEGRKLAIELVKDLIKVIVDGIHHLHGGGEHPAENSVIMDKIMEVRAKIQTFQKNVGKDGLNLMMDMAMDTLKIVITKEDENGLAEIWEKLKATIAKVKGSIKESTMKTLAKYKPQILDAIKNLKTVVISCGKDLVISIRDGVVKILKGGEIANSNSKAGEKIKEWWHKVEAAFKRLGEKIKATAISIGMKIAGLGAKIGKDTAKLRAKIAKMAKEIGEKIVKIYKPLSEKYKKVIIDALKTSGKVIIDEGRTIVIAVVKGVVKIVIDGIHMLGGKYTFDSSEGVVADNDFKEIWGKIKAAVGAEIGHYKTEIKAMVKKYTPRLLAALKKVKAVIIKDGKNMLIDMLSQIMRIILGWGYDNAIANNDLTEVWQKLKIAVGAEFERVKTELKAMVKKYTPQIVAELEKVKHVIIKDGKNMLIDMLSQLMKIILGWSYDDAIEYNSFTDMWEKIKATAQKLKSTVRDTAIKTLEKYKPKIAEAISKLKHVVIACGKELVIQIKDGIIKIIADGSTATSDGSSPAEFYFEGDYVMLVFKDANLAADNGFKETWAKVKEAFKRFGEKIKGKSLEIWQKVGPGVRKAVDKYKDIIIDALEKDGKVIINEGRKIVITVINDVVKVIIDGIDAMTGGKKPENEIAENGFKELWHKVYDHIIAKLGAVMGKASIDTIKKHKEAFMKALKRVGLLILEGGHKLAVKVIKDVNETIIEIFVDGKKVSEVEEKKKFQDSNALVENEGFMKKLWGQVYHDIVTKLGAVVGKATIDTIKKHKEKFMKSLERLGHVVVEGGRKISVKVIKDVKETIIDIFVDGKKVDEVEGKPKYALENKSFQEIWDKIKAAVHHLDEAVRNTTMKVVKEFKPQILEALQTLKKVVVKGVKTVIIEVRDAIIKVISGGKTATSDGSSFDSDVKIYGVIEENSIFAVVDV